MLTKNSSAPLTTFAGIHVAETVISHAKQAFQNNEKQERAEELIFANQALAYQNQEKENRAHELRIANKELAYKNKEKENLAAELIIANKELAFQNEEKEKRAAELAIANKELVFQNNEKEKRAIELINANRLYTFLSQINQAIVHSKNEQALLNEVCRITIEVGKFELGALSFPDIAKRRLNIVTHCNALPSDIEFLNRLTYDDNGPTAQVLKTGKPYIINDYEYEPAISSSKKYALGRGFRSCILLPIRKSGKTVGAFNIFSAQTNLFDTAEVALLEEASSDISFAIDIFEKEQHRKQMRASIIQSEVRLKQAQSIAHFGGWELDLSTGKMLWSEEACRIYGVSPAKGVCTYEVWLSLTHPEDVAHVANMVKEGAGTSGSIDFSHRIVRPDGSIRHICSQAQFEFDKEGKASWLYGVAHDITEIRQAEKERLKMISDLVQRNNDLEQFSYIVSHNLRAPVANILGLVSLIKTIGIDKGEEQKVTDYLLTAAQNLDHVIMDINHILELKNNQGGKRECILLDQLLNEVKANFNNNSVQANITGNFMAEEITTVKSYLYSIFFNLISNSIRYARPGVWPEINISSVKRNNKMKLVFKDNGMGIDLEKNGKEVFGLYKRFHYHLEGKGMGLFMVKTQVELLGGKITVASKANEGATFSITFETEEAML